jgi:hypothetical protein
MVTNNAINLSASGITGYDGAGTFNGNAVTQHSLLLGGANSHTINNLGVATNGQIPIGSTGADPVLATLSAGTGVTITNGAGSITVSSSGGGLTWVDVTGITQAMAVNTGYIADNVGLVTMTLPATAAQGTVVAVAGGNSGTGGWKIAQNSGQQINFGKATTTSGTGGSLASTLQYDCVYLLCTTANTNWVVLNSVGNITVV